ncbi:Regulator of chromosome condensation [Macleaya cordata]|uniref:Regulator of chromosome condensation n=1 Tax=Macleaya cordata TaxID=56857 RepID=A0A200PRS6_MACCD|nr:Regulator of chromosome condensation [Macleaya cordata]
MEGSVLPSGQKQARRFSSGGSQKDLWFVMRQGSLHEVDSALSLLKKNGGNIDTRNMFGLTPLHIATWRNHIPIVRRLLAAGADPDARDGESGWSSLHRALNFGHLAVASILLQSGASLTLEDSKSRTPVDLLSGPVSQVVGSERNSVAMEVYSWGSGANYQLGTGNAHIQKLPCKVDALQGSYIKMVSAAKFHSVAIGARGEVYTWGFGRGGRLGHPDFDIHSGQAAVITPRQVTSGLGSRRVKAIAAAKHHTVVATEGGEVFTWGSNREGQLGYTSVDTQPTPRRVSSLRSKIVAVAAANKHTSVISDSGEVFTWGCNKEGQLGYGTSNSASNYTPRLVEYLKGKVFVGVTAAKYHTIVLGADGEVFTWGHRLVTPRRVVIARNIKKSETTQLKFHRMERLHVVAVAAGMVHSMALTDDGALFYWVSSDPDLRCQQLYSMCARNLVSISAGKYWTAAVTTTGDIYMWDGKKGKGEPPHATRLHGVKRATSVSVGETHLLIVCALYHPIYPPKLAENPEKPRIENLDESEEFDEDSIFNSMETEKVVMSIQNGDSGNRPVPSLKSLCEKVAAETLVEPRNSIQLLEIADSLGADDLRKHCEDMAIRNLDYIFTVSAQAIASASPDILANLEKLLDMKSSEPWSYRRLPTPTATFPAIVYSEEEDSDSEYLRVRDNQSKSILKFCGDKRLDCFLQPNDAADEAIAKQVRALRKKLQQIDMLEAKQFSGHHLDDQQIAKLQTRSALESSLAELGVPVETQGKPTSPVVDGKGCKKVEVEVTSSVSYEDVVEEPHPIKGFLEIEIPKVPEQKEGCKEFEETGSIQVLEDSSCSPKKSTPTSQKKLSSSASKKKSKKGGLSMFLSGALDDAPREAAPPPPTPKSEGPAWGGAKIPIGSTSLREIQTEQSRKKEGQPIRKLKGEAENHVEGKNSGQIRLSSFLPVGGGSSPIAMVSVRASPVSDGEKGTPPWAAAGTSPIFCRPSLRDIQMQQEKRHQQSLSHSPKTSTTGFSVSSSQGSPSDSSGGMNRWFKPEINSPSSIRSIQIEEKAMKDLKRYYSSVKLVRSQNQVQ